MSKGYLVAHISVHDKEGFQKFVEMATPVIGEYGGKVLAREPAPDVREGKRLWSFSRSGSRANMMSTIMRWTSTAHPMRPWRA